MCKMACEDQTCSLTLIHTSQGKDTWSEAPSNRDKGTEPFIDRHREVVRKCFLGKLLFILDLSNF